jgi:hypothetical protein
MDFLARDLDVSFSNVKYTQIAPSEGLVSPMNKDIVKDIEIVMDPL